MEKKLDGNYTRMLQAILNKSWRQHPTKQPIMKKLSKLDESDMQDTAGEAGNELITDVHLRTPSHGWAKVGWPARTYIQQLCEDMGCSPEVQPEAMNDRVEWRERVRDICADGTTRWWWWWLCKYLCWYT